MNMEVLEESPDSLVTYDGGKYGVFDKGNITFICDGVGGYSFADTTPDGYDHAITHPDLVKDALRVFAGATSYRDKTMVNPMGEHITEKLYPFRKKAWEEDYGLAELGEEGLNISEQRVIWADISPQLSFNSRKMDMLSFSGRYFKEPHVITFWQKSTEMVDKYPLLDILIEAMGVSKENLELEFIDFERWFIPYGSPIKNVGKNKEEPEGQNPPKKRSEKKIRELQQAQHLDPKAKKQLRANDEVFTPEPKIKDPLKYNHYSRFSEGSEFTNTTNQILEL